MDLTQMLTIIGSILVPMFACFGWVIHMLFGIKEDIRSIDSRLAKLEGAFEERGRWESRKDGTSR